ncbi:MAG: RrF2 family transcriptional regulator [Spirochaetaceae bacterium]
MRITTKGRYALRAVLRLARENHERPVSIRVLSEMEDISPEFLEQIFFRMRKSDLISSTRGPGGGFMIKHPLSEITVADLFEAVGEELHFSPCTEENEGPCGREEVCPAHKFWEYTYSLFRRYFEQVTLEDIVEGRKKVPDWS